jgi:dihydrofolate reductase
MSQTRIHNFSISLDGFGTGEGQSLETPMGHATRRLPGWMFATRFGAAIVGLEGGGSVGVDNAIAEQHEYGIGAEIMGANKFGPPGWQDDADWKGWWGPNPPFHTPTFVLTHRPRPSIEMEGGTTFHFLDASPVEAVDAARAAAGKQDVRVGGGPTMVRDFIAAGLVDHIHFVQVPMVLARGVRVWDGLEGLEANYELEAVSTPSGVTHLIFNRKTS